jgi:hypothetical protein
LDSLLDSSSSSNQPLSITINSQVGAFLITPLGISPPQPNFGLSHQSLLRLEAVCVDEEVYDAILMTDIQDNNAPGWWKRTQKYKILGLVFVASTAIIAAVAVVAGSRNDPTRSNAATDPVMTSTASTTIMTSNTSTSMPATISVSEIYLLHAQQ